LDALSATEAAITEDVTIVTVADCERGNLPARAMVLAGLRMK